MSEFWKRKIETGFTRIDYDQDGAVTIKDFHALADKLIESRHVDEERGTKLRTILTDIWDNFFSKMANGNPVDKHVFVECTKHLVKSGDEILKSIETIFFPLWFAAVDANGDGIIQESEYIEFFRALGFSSDVAKAAFQCMDTDQDGLLSLKEYVEAGMDYIKNEDEEGKNTGKCFFGPLV